jgi:acetolactate synthase-1/2/3 large subunit
VAPDASSACVLAAVTGEILERPGAALAPLADALSLRPGLALAARDRCPSILVTDLHADAALLAPVVKATVVLEPASAGHWIAHAANLAMTDPRGPVHVMCAEAVAAQPAVPVATAVRPAPLPPPTAAALEALGDVLARASRPLVLTGLECGPGDAKWVRAFAESLPAPVLGTPKGRGVLPEPHPLALGLAEAGHPLLARTDLVVLVGVDAMELPPGVLPARAVARIDRASWPEAASPPVVEVQGDIALVIEELAPRVRARPAADWDVAELDRVKRAAMQRARATPTSRVVAIVREATPAGTIVASDVPLGLAWQAVAPREVLTPLGGVVPPGYAALAAVAAQLADRDRRVVAFTAPGHRAATSTALAMAETLTLPIVVVELGQERDEPAFAMAFSRTFASRRPAVV